MKKALTKNKQKNIAKLSQEGDSPEIRKPSYISKITSNLIIHIFIIAALGLIAYSNTFNSPFVFDDSVNIVENPLIKSLDNFIFPSEGYKGYLPRAVCMFTFALNYHFGGLDVTGYHIVNLIIHIVNAILVYFLVALTFKTPYLQNPNSKLLTNLIPLFVALLFVSHPIQTQAVTYIVQRFTSLAAMFYLLSIVLYIKARLKSHDIEQGQGILNLKSVIWYLSSIISAVLAMFTKEIAFTLPIVIAIYEFFFFRSPLKKRLLILLPFMFTLLIIPLSILETDKPFGEMLSDVVEKTKVQTEMTRWSYLMTQMRVITTYIRLLFLPINQNLDYDYPIYHSLFDLPVLFSFLFLLSIFILGIYLFYLSRFRVNSAESQFSNINLRLISFGIFWFFITLSVESSIIPIVDVIFEHRVYLPSVGMLIAVTTSVFIIKERIKKRLPFIQKAFIPTFAVVIIILTGASYARNMVWSSEVTLWEDVVRKSPNKARGHNNLAIAYKNMGFLDKAVEHYQIAIRLRPNYAQAHYNLGNIFENKNLLDQAMEHYIIAIKLKPDFASAYSNLGIVFKRKGFFDKAIESYKEALRINPNFHEAHNNLGDLYFNKGLIDKAIEHFQTAIGLKPDYLDAHYNLGVAYMDKGLENEAIEHFQTAIRLNPKDADAHYNLGIVYMNKGLSDKAKEHFDIARRLNPELN